MPATGASDPWMVVPPHLHTGLQTVTWLLSGEVLHQDSIGSEQVVRPGPVNLLTAGRCISHAESSTPASPPLRGVQLWVALPDSARSTAPGFEHHDDLPLVTDGGLSASVLLGSLAGARSPATAYTPIVGADLAVAPGPVGELALRARLGARSARTLPGSRRRR
ncbi:MAG: pirin family protein [Spirochaetaceae bacterium]|nr:pirin family protein [Spirochaetaceae bacterium]